MSTEPSESPVSETSAIPAAVVNILLALTVIGLLGSAVCAVGWYRSAHRAVGISDLSQEDRQRLVESFFETTGRAYVPAWFEPDVAYTLRLKEEIKVWGDEFRSNALGYRAPAEAKPEGTFRIVFVGDSWTYGMGEPQENAFPAQFEALANQMAAGSLPEGFDRVEAWSLALPGYNTFNQVRALEIFFDRIDPDMVILCPTRNDNDSNYFIMPNGSNKRPSGVYQDRFGDDIARVYLPRSVASHAWQERWRRAFERVTDAEEWLGEREIPLHLFFVAYWETEIVHNLVREAGLGAPYLIAPKEMVMEERWRGKTQWRHGTPEAYALYARMLYRSVAAQLGWPELEIDPELDVMQAEIFASLPEGDWQRLARDKSIEMSSRLDTELRPSDEMLHHCLGELDCATGLMGRKAVVMLRRAEGASHAQVTLGPVEQDTDLYPLDVSLTIPSAGGSTRSEVRLTGEGEQTFRIELPADVAVSEVFELELRAERVTLAPDILSLRSLMLIEVSQD